MIHNTTSYLDKVRKRDRDMKKERDREGAGKRD